MGDTMPEVAGSGANGTANSVTGPTAEDGQFTMMRIQRSVWQFAAIMALVDIGCPEQLRGGPLTVAELADRCGAHAPTLSRLLRTVAATGLLRTVQPGGYELTEAGQAMLGGRAMLSVRFTADPAIWAPLGELTETVRTGQSPFVRRHGSLYNYLSSNGEASAIFDNLMTAIHGPLAARLAEVGDFAEVQTVVDVGGGRGTFLAAILRAHTGLHGILLELDRAVDAANQYLTANGVAERSEVVAGDFFAAVPAGAEAYLLAHVLHNWDDDQATDILRTVRAAIPGHGRLLVVEALVPEDDRPHPSKDLDIRLLTLHEGKERSHAEYVDLLAKAGFQGGPVTELGAGTSLTIAIPG
jgi:hypothetical protein